MSQESASPQSDDTLGTQFSQRPGEPLDELSQRILLLLSSGQSLSIHEIARTLEIPMEMAWKNLAPLERTQLITTSNGRIRLGTDGLRLLQKWGIIKPGVVTVPSPRPAKRALPMALVGSVPDLMIWAIVPVTVIFGLAVLFVMVLARTGESM